MSLTLKALDSLFASMISVLFRHICCWPCLLHSLVLVDDQLWQVNCDLCENGVELNDETNDLMYMCNLVLCMYVTLTDTLVWIINTLYTLAILSSSILRVFSKYRIFLELLNQYWACWYQSVCIFILNPYMTIKIKRLNWILVSTFSWRGLNNRHTPRFHV